MAPWPYAAPEIPALGGGGGLRPRAEPTKAPPPPPRSWHPVGPNFSHHKARVQAVGWFPLGTRKQESRPFAAPTPPTPNRKGAGLKAGPAPPLPQASPPPAPAPLTPPFPGSASGPSHGCPPTLHPPPGAPVGDPTAALHLPPSPAAPVGDPTAALAPSPSQAGPLYRRPSGRAVNPMNCWVAVAGSSPFLPLVPPTHNTGNTV